MTTIGGNIDPWASRFPHDQIPNVLKLILESWKTFDPPDDLLEVPITKKFYLHLLTNQNRSLDFFQINWESYILEDGETIRRLDLKFIQGWDVEVYFSIECKLLRVTRASGRIDTLADKYISQGMLRYVNGQYASGLDRGGMLGYVMDGQTEKAIQDVKKAIEYKRSDLKIKSGEVLRGSSAVSSRQVKETYHNFGPRNNFRLYHIFLPIIHTS